MDCLRPAILWRWLPDKQDDGRYVLYSALANGIDLDVHAAGAANGTNIDVYSYNGTEAQWGLPRLNFWSSIIF